MRRVMACLDASVALKLLVAEEDSDRARSLWRRWAATGIQAVAPALFLFECVSALRRIVVRGDLEDARASRVLKRLVAMPVSFPVLDGMAERAWDLARRLDRPAAYDCFYLAVAELLNVELWTADRRFFNAVRPRLSWVHHLDEQGA